jgi:CRISPR system Cascade subunit CasC
MTAKFVQIHSLTSYAPALLNRDDAGFAKRIPFGGASRTRVSSQCLKRHWRTFEGKNSLDEIDVPGSVRSRVTFERFVVQPLLEQGYNEIAVRTATADYMSSLLGESEKAKAAKKAAKEEGEENEELKTGQITILGRPEINFIKQEVKTVCDEHNEAFVSAGADKKALKAAEKDLGKSIKERLKGEGKKNLKALAYAAGLDAALFGRMVTSDILSRVDAAVHVAHSLTVHEEASESDYFSAVDDLVQGQDGELGSGHINSSELTTGLFYGYTVVDVAQLLSNLTGADRNEVEDVDPTLAAEVIKRLVHLIATISPGAKLGSTAPYSHASLLLVETGEEQPRTLANAFLKPVSPRPDLLANTYAALGDYVADLDSMYGGPKGRSFVGVGPTDHLTAAVEMTKSSGLKDLADWTAEQVQGG